MKLEAGKRFREGEQIPHGTWTIIYWPDGGCSITNHVRVAHECTYELLHFEPPAKPLVPEVGKWYLVKATTGRSGGYIKILQYRGRGMGMLDFDGDVRLNAEDYEFLEEWAPVKK